MGGRERPAGEDVRIRVRGEEVVMEVPMESGEEEVVALREQLRQVQGRVEHLRRIGLEQSRSLAVTVPELEAAVELSLKVSAFGPPGGDLG